MGKYVIITPEIGNMGGAQMFTENKVRYLRSHNWEVFVFYYIPYANPKLPLLQEYSGNWIPELSYGFFYVPKYKITQICKRIASIVGDGEIIIETQLITLAYWGELFARYLGARHIINALEEQIPVFSDKENKFFEYKLKRWEFMNATEKRLHNVFKGRYKDEYLKYTNSVSFKCTNVVSEDNTVEIELPNCDYTILSIGRLDKDYVIPMTNEIKKFCLSYPNKKFNIIYVGGSLDGSKEREIPLMLKCENANVYMMGYTFPISYDIIKSADVSIASANSVLVTADNGVPTICVDMNDSFGIGVYNFTTMNKFTRKSEPQIEISALLDEILIQQKYPKSNDRGNSSSQSLMDEEFAKELDYLNRSRENMGYYDMESLYSRSKVLFSQMKWFVHEGLGIK